MRRFLQIYNSCFGKNLHYLKNFKKNICVNVLLNLKLRKHRDDLQQNYLKGCPIKFTAKKRE